MNATADARERFDALHAAASGGRDAAAGCELAWMLVRMRPDRQHADIERAWEAAFAAPWHHPALLAPAALAYLAMHPSVRRALGAHDDADAMSAFAHLSKQRLFRLLMSRALVTAPQWQDLFRRLRAAAMRGTSVPGLEWIAVQANLAEYVWPSEAGEPDLQRLRDRVASDKADSRDAVLLACFEHPGAEAQFALGDTEGEQLLVQRLYREPAEERSIAAGLAAKSRDTLPHRAQRDQYERYPYPRWIAEPMLPAAIPPAVQERISKPWWRRQKVLLAGCGTGQQCIAARCTYPEASITAFDFSVTSLSYAMRKCREAGVTGIDFEPADLLAYPKRGRRFDVVECIGVLHHLSDLDAGAAALRACVREGGVLRLAVYSEPARGAIRELRTLIARHGLDGSLPSLRGFRAQLLAGAFGVISPSILESPDLHSASGLHDLLFNACEHSLGAVAWTALMERHGFSLVCMDPPAATLAAAGEHAAAWTPAQWEDYERTHPFAFASMYEFWFVAR